MPCAVGCRWTPGASAARVVKPRLANGRFWTDSVGMVNDRSPLDAWISGFSALTTTVSAVPPISSVITPSEILDPGLTATFDC